MSALGQKPTSERNHLNRYRATLCGPEITIAAARVIVAARSSSRADASRGSLQYIAKVPTIFPVVHEPNYAKALESFCSALIALRCKPYTCGWVRLDCCTKPKHACRTADIGS